MTATVRKKTSARRQREALHGAAYVPADVLPGVCVYCGGPSTGLDHVPPLVAVGWFGSVAPRWLYPACGVCNASLATYPAVCLVERAEYVVCILRREVIRLRAGKSKRWSMEVVTRNGRACKDRLATGATAKACRCRACTETGGGLPTS